MKAARLTAYGDPAAGIVLHDVSEPPALAPDEVLVQMRYAPINVSDLMVARGVYDWRPSLPEVLGNEGSGVVVATGRDVAGYMPGASVVLPFMARTWRERLVAKAEQLTRVPVGVDLRQAAMATINLVTAAMLLDDYVELSPGDAIVYNAANSGLGHCLAGLASRRDIRTIGLVRRQEDVERVRQSGCEIVWLDQDQACADQAGLAGMAVKLALDGVGGASAGRLASLLSPEGALVAYGAASHRPMEVSAQHLIFKRISVHGFFEGRPENMSRVRDTLISVLDALASDGIRQPVAAVYPITRLKEALAHAVNGGKVLLAFESAMAPLS
ncbi:Alcohol dehydrogenase [Burkholderia gladioli]|uniref:MDR family NADPH-dependent oxidoreductase n=1 Tax=Burkholderia gladioli TaxID=28095 RepID=UPI001CAAF8FD|nr:2-enoyl thioester reductase domain-containing protein [Burkholderia gladioli]CAG9218780.1 Alcohol dehydrogenase [Burkholderia gladioli]